MPFGLSTAPATFQRFLSWVLHVVTEGVIHYVDDILIGGRTLKDEGLRQRELKVGARLETRAVPVDTEKSGSEVQEVDFVGLRIRDDTIGSALPRGSKPRPTTKEEWWSALGFANCYRDFLPTW